MSQIQPHAPSPTPPTRHGAQAAGPENRAVAELAAAVAAACEGAPEEMSRRVQAALVRAAADPTLLSPAEREPREDRYARHVIHSDAQGRFTILSIVWGPGQFSAPHAHHTWCGYAVRQNSLRETLYAMNTKGKAEPVRTEPRNPGFSCFAEAGLDQIHKLGNPGGAPAISIHVYGVDHEHISSHVNRMVDAEDDAACPN